MPFTRDRLTWANYLLLGYFAYLVNAFGPVITFLRAELRLSYTVASLHTSAYALGAILSGLLAARAVRRWGRRAVCWTGASGMALGCVLLTLGTSPLLTIASAALMGLLGAFVVILVQATLADQHGERRGTAFAESNVVAGVGAMLAPLLVGSAERSGLGWRSALWLVVLVLALLALCFGREPFPQPARAGRTDGAARAPLPAAFWAYWIVMLLIVSTEFCLLLWGADFLATVGGLTRSGAAAALSGFLLAVVVGRLVGSRLAGYIVDARLFRGALALTGAGFGLYWLAGWAPLNVAGLVVAGLGSANLYPLALALAVGVVPEQADLASARCALAAGIAILLAPLLLAVLADQVGIRNAYAVVIPLLVAALLISQRAPRMGAGRVVPWPAPDRSDSDGGGG